MVFAAVSQAPVTYGPALQFGGPMRLLSGMCFGLSTDVVRYCFDYEAQVEPLSRFSFDFCIESFLSIMIASLTLRLTLNLSALSFLALEVAPTSFL